MSFRQKCPHLLSNVSWGENAHGSWWWLKPPPSLTRTLNDCFVIQMYVHLSSDSPIDTASKWYLILTFLSPSPVVSVFRTRAIFVNKSLYILTSCPLPAHLESSCFDLPTLSSTTMFLFHQVSLFLSTPRPSHMLFSLLGTTHQHHLHIISKVTASRWILISPSCNSPSPGIPWF
jgi:hypothetical protein